MLFKINPKTFLYHKRKFLTETAVIFKESTVECVKRYHKTGPVSPVIKPCAWQERVVQTFSIIFAAKWFTIRSSYRKESKGKLTCKCL